LEIEIIYPVGLCAIFSLHSFAAVKQFHPPQYIAGFICCCGWNVCLVLHGRLLHLAEINSVTFLLRNC